MWVKTQFYTVYETQNEIIIIEKDLKLRRGTYNIVKSLFYNVQLMTLII